MRSIAFHVVVASLLCAAPGRGQVPADVPRLPSVELPEELDRVLRDYERGWASGNARALATLFTEDGFVPDAGGWVSGRERIEAQYARSGGELRLRALAYALDGSVGWIVGAYGYGAAADEADRGKFVLALRRADDGRWLIAADLDNTNRPPEPGGG